MYDMGAAPPNVSVTESFATLRDGYGRARVGWDGLHDQRNERDRHRVVWPSWAAPIASAGASGFSYAVAPAIAASNSARIWSPPWARQSLTSWSMELSGARRSPPRRRRRTSFDPERSRAICRLHERAARMRRDFA